MPKVHFSELEVAQPQSIGFRKEVLINTNTTRRQIKENQGREALSERNSRKKRISQLAHARRQFEKAEEQKAAKIEAEEQKAVMMEEFTL